MSLLMLKTTSPILTQECFKTAFNFKSFLGPKPPRIETATISVQAISVFLVALMASKREREQWFLSRCLSILKSRVLAFGSRVLKSRVFASQFKSHEFDVQKCVFIGFEGSRCVLGEKLRFWLRFEVFG